MKKAFRDFIARLEEQKYYDILQATMDMGKLPKPKDLNEKTPPDELAETYAINFFATSTEGRETYTYGPKWVLPMGDSSEMREFPSRALVTPEMITYWEKRMGETNNVTLRARYADLIYDFLDAKTEGRRKFQAGRVFADSAIELIEHGQTEYDNFRQMVKRGLYLSQMIKNEELTTQYIDKLVNLADDDRYSDFVFNHLR